MTSPYLKKTSDANLRSLPPMREKRCGLGVAMSPDGRFLYAVGGYAAFVFSVRGYASEFYRYFPEFMLTKLASV